MAYVIAEPCIDVKDKACVEVCPVDCIYEGPTQLFIHPDECSDCGACEPVCPVKGGREAGAVEAVHRAEQTVLRGQPRGPGRHEELSGPREGAILMWVYEFTCGKCREVFVRSLGPGRAVQCPACGSSALDARLDPLSELILLLVSAATQSIRGLRRRIGRGYAMRSRWVSDAR